MAVEIVQRILELDPTIGFGLCSHDILAGDRVFGHTRESRRGSFTTIQSPTELARFSINYLSLRSRQAPADELVGLISDVVPAELVSVHASSSATVEVLPVGCSKATGLSALCEHLGIDHRNVIAYGDSPNDIDLIRCAGLGVAVADAHPEVRSVAQQIADRHDNDGVARHLRTVFPAAKTSP